VGKFKSSEAINKDSRKGTKINNEYLFSYLVQLKAGRANPLSLHTVKSLRRLSPVTTPGGISARDMVNYLIEFV